MNTTASFLSQFFGVALHAQTYRNALYLLLSFPLGLAYFIFLVVGFSVGIPLSFLGIGLLILALVFAGWYALVAFERKLAIILLREEIPPMSYPAEQTLTFWQSFGAALTNSVTWKGLVYLVAKFPLGLLSFVLLVTFGALASALMTVPFYYTSISPQITLNLGQGVFHPVWYVDTLPKALVCSAAGVLIGLVSLHIFNALAWFNAKFARVMLGNFGRPYSA